MRPGRVDADGDRVGDVELCVRHDADQHDRDRDVDHRADREGGDGSRSAGRAGAGDFPGAAVETASKPMYAKNITPVARSTPLQPNEPKWPVFGDERVRSRVLHVRGTGDDEDDEHERFHDDEDRVRGGGLLDALHEQRGDGEHDQRGGQVEHAARRRELP